MLPKVLFVINSLAGGGAERVMTTLLAHSGPWRDRYDISLALLDEEPAAYPVPDWITVHRLDCGKSVRKSIGRLRTLVTTLCPVATVSFLARANVANWVSHLGNDMAWVISERVNPDAHFGSNVAGAIRKAMMRFCYRRATHVIAVSQGVADDLAEKYAVPTNRMSVIANPVDMEAIQQQARAEPAIAIEPPYIVAMGRLVENKNFALLIDAFATSAIPGKLLIIGDGPLRPLLEERIAVYGLQDRVILTGFMQNPFPLLARAQFFVLPSNAEGFPNGLVEAMSTGTAVISTNCKSGPSEILAESRSASLTKMTPATYGILVPCNRIDAMADALRYFQQDKVRNEYAELALVRTRGYTPEKAASRYWQAIESALEQA